MFLFIFIGTQQENILKQQPIECNSVEHYIKQILSKLILKIPFLHIFTFYTFLMTWSKDFDSSLIKINKKSYKYIASIISVIS